jgi:hypothetical protein
MTEGPSINVDEFRHRPVNEIAAILPNKEAVKAAIKDLEAANVEISTIRVLHGEKGVQILDPTGAEHGLGTQIVRWYKGWDMTGTSLTSTRRRWIRASRLLRCPVTPRIAAFWAG